MNVQCIISLWAGSKKKDALLVGAGDHFLPVNKLLGWGVGAAEC